MILRVETGNREPPCCQIIQEGQPRSAPKTAAQQVVDLCSDRSGDYQLSGLLAQQGFNSRLLGVTPVRHRDQRPGVD